jgi:hypothetical protein
MLSMAVISGNVAKTHIAEHKSEKNFCRRAKGWAHKPLIYRVL